MTDEPLGTHVLELEVVDVIEETSDARSLVFKVPDGASIPAFFAALATIASSSRCEHSPNVTGSFGVMLEIFQCERSRIPAIVVRVVPMRRPIAPSEISGWLRRIQAMPSGLSCRLETGV